MESAKPRVLVVEDHPDIGELYRRLMPGCMVTSAISGGKACRALEDGPYDLIVLDMHLGSISGLDVLRFMRHERSDETTPVIAISADDDLRSDAKAIGISYWLNKPLDIDRFYEYLNALRI